MVSPGELVKQSVVCLPVTCILIVLIVFLAAFIIYVSILLDVEYELRDRLNSIENLVTTGDSILSTIDSKMSQLIEIVQ